MESYLKEKTIFKLQSIINVSFIDDIKDKAQLLN